MTRSIKNTTASAHQLLLNKAKESSRPFNELLQRFANERFIYRLSKSPHVDRFILKGAQMLSVWSGPGSRPTMDIDLLGRIDNSLEVIAAAMKDVCEMDVEADGMFFNAETVAAMRQRPEDAASFLATDSRGQRSFSMRSRISHKEIVLSFLRCWIIFQKPALVW
jgi:hypothetical protein